MDTTNKVKIIQAIDFICFAFCFVILKLDKEQVSQIYKEVL